MVYIKLTVSAVALVLAIANGLGGHPRAVGDEVPVSQQPVVLEGSNSTARPTFPTTSLNQVFEPTTFLTRYASATTAGTLVSSAGNPQATSDRKGRARGQFQPFKGGRPRGFYLANSTGYQGVKNILGRMINKNGASVPVFSNFTTVEFKGNETLKSRLTAYEISVNISGSANAEIQVFGGKGNLTVAVPGRLEEELREFLGEVEDLERTAEEQLVNSLSPQEEQQLEQKVFGEAVQEINSPPTTPTLATSTIPEGISLGEVIRNCNFDPTSGNLAACACVVTESLHDADMALVDVDCFDHMNREYAALMVEDENYYRYYLEHLDKLRLKKRGSLTPRGEVFCPVTTTGTFDAHPEVIVGECFSERDVAYLLSLQKKIDRDLFAGHSVSHKKLLSRGLLSQKTSRHIKKRGLEGLEGLNLDMENLSTASDAQIEELVFNMSDEQLLELLSRLEKVSRQDTAGLVRLAKRELDGFARVEGLQHLATAEDEVVEKYVLGMSEKQLGELLMRLEMEDRKRRK